jgi:hypothetical protein
MIKKNSGKTVAMRIMQEYGFGNMIPPTANLTPDKSGQLHSHPGCIAF